MAEISANSLEGEIDLLVTHCADPDTEQMVFGHLDSLDSVEAAYVACAVMDRLREPRRQRFLRWLGAWAGQSKVILARERAARGLRAQVIEVVAD